MYQEVLQALDWPMHGQAEPQLYVTQTPIANAGAVGFGNPFIVISSGTLELLEPDEQRFVLAHEVGHIMTGHTTYRTIALIVLFFGRCCAAGVHRSCFQPRCSVVSQVELSPIAGMLARRTRARSDDVSQTRRRSFQR
jgi:Zn-dependent protease with chaperone function